MYRVRWIKALDGFGGTPIVAANARHENTVREMAEEIGEKRDEWLAVYVTAKVRPGYSPKPHPSMVQGFVQVERLKKGENLHRNCGDYEWNKKNSDGSVKKWPICFRVKQPWKKIPCSLIKIINNQLQNESYDSGKQWSSFHSALRNTPRRIDSENYSLVGDHLTSFINAHFDELEDQDDLGDQPYATTCACPPPTAPRPRR